MGFSEIKIDEKSKKSIDFIAYFLNKIIANKFSMKIFSKYVDVLFCDSCTASNFVPAFANNRLLELGLLHFRATQFMER